MKTYSHLTSHPSRLFKFFLLSAVVCSFQNSYARMDSPEKRKSADDYEVDGHYWTVLVAATLLKIEHAKEIAYSAEFPDNVINSDGYCVRSRPTFLFPKAQTKVHALTGGNPEYERNLSQCMLRSAKTPQEIGTALHRLGDSFAHTNDKTGRMYPHIIGHTLLWKRPDKIEHNAEKYLTYVHALITGLGGNPDKIDLGVFHYIANAHLGVDANAAILKSEYNLLIGSIAFRIEPEELLDVENYLDKRMDSGLYAVHNSTDGKGRTATTIILANNNTVTKFLFPASDSAVVTTGVDN